MKVYEVNKKFNKAFFYAVETVDLYQHDIEWSNPDITKNIVVSSNVWFQEFSGSDMVDYMDCIDYECTDDTISFNETGYFSIRFKDGISIVLVDQCEGYIVWTGHEIVSEKFNNIENLKYMLQTLLDGKHVEVLLQRPEGSQVFTGRKMGVEYKEFYDINTVFQREKSCTIKFPVPTFAINPSFFEGFFEDIFFNCRFNKDMFYQKIKVVLPGYDIDSSLEEALNRMKRLSDGKLNNKG